MKKLLNILLGIFISLIYIPFSIIISYTSISTLTNMFNKNYTNIFLNVLFGIIGILVLLVLIYLLEKIIKKVVEKKIRFMAICCFIPIILFCISMIILNFNFFNIQKDIVSLNMELLGESTLLKTALMSISALFFTLAFIYLIVFVMYLIVHKISNFMISKNK